MIMKNNSWRSVMAAGLLLFSGTAVAGYFPVFSTWSQPDGLGSQITLTYSYSNLFDGSIKDFATGEAIPETVLRSAFEIAFQDYANFLPIDFVEVLDTNGPLPETGEYNPAGLADIRIGQVAHVDGANAYAYFPLEGSGLAGDVVFNAGRFGSDWPTTLFYGVAQHELGHSLGMGHFIADDPLDFSVAAQNSGYTGPLFPLDTRIIEALQGAYGVGTGSVSPIPLPASFWLFASGLIFLFSRKRELRRNA